jgi:hypothetical protein
MKTLKHNAHYRQNDNPWTDLLDIIPEVELAPLISAIVKMKRNEVILTPPELTAYYHWYVGFEEDEVENLWESFSDADLDWLGSVEQQIEQGEPALTPRNVEAYYQLVSQFENVTDQTSLAFTSDSTIDLLISVEEKMRRGGLILTPQELDAYRHWHPQIGILNSFEFDDNK